MAFRSWPFERRESRACARGSNELCEPHAQACDSSTQRRKEAKERKDGDVEESGFRGQESEKTSGLRTSSKDGESGKSNLDIHVRENPPSALKPDGRDLHPTFSKDGEREESGFRHQESEKTSGISKDVESEKMKADSREPTANRVLLITTNHDAQTSYKPRLQAAGADLSKVTLFNTYDAQHPITGQYKPTKWGIHTSEIILDKLLAEHGPFELVVIDDIDRFADRKQRKEWSDQLEKLSDVAAEHNASILCLGTCDTSKKTRSQWEKQTTFASVWGILRDKWDSENRQLLPIRNRFAPDNQGFAFQIVNRQGQPHVEWNPDLVGMSFDEAYIRNRSKKRITQTMRAEIWLMSYLKDGSRLSLEIFRDGYDLGFSDYALRNALRHVAIKEKTGFQGQWRWHLRIGIAEENPLLASYRDDSRACARGSNELDAQSCEPHAQACDSSTQSRQDADLRKDGDVEEVGFGSQDLEKSGDSSKGGDVGSAVRTEKNIRRSGGEESSKDGKAHSNGTDSSNAEGDASCASHTGTSTCDTRDSSKGGEEEESGFRGQKSEKTSGFSKDGESENLKADSRELIASPPESLSTHDPSNIPIEEILRLMEPPE